MTKDRNGLMMQLLKQVPKFICEHATVKKMSNIPPKSDSGDKQGSFMGFMNFKESSSTRGYEAANERLGDISRPETGFLGASNVWVEHEDKFMTKDLPYEDIQFDTNT